MDFTFTEEQLAIRELASRMLADRVTVERLKQVEQGDGVDRDLWRELGSAGLLALVIPESHGGSGLGMLDLALLLEAQGRHVAPLPLWPTMVAALALGEHGTAPQRERWLPAVAAGDAVLTVAFEDPAGAIVTAREHDSEWRLGGTKLAVPALPIADAVLVTATTSAGDALFLLDPAAGGAAVDTVAQTDQQPAGHLMLEDAPAELIAHDGDGAIEWVRNRAYVAIAALQTGVCEEALRRAAEYASTRTQFGKPLSTFQGVAIRAADAYIDTDALRSTMWQAAWRLDQGLDATAEVLVAKWWACEAGHRVVHAAQHLHGGIGADVDYPQHRWFLWGTQLQDTLGGPSSVLERLGDCVA
jgi:3-oxocholest-4-en-26-oyl-CoA dehydrogenase beta subunit